LPGISAREGCGATGHACKRGDIQSKAEQGWAVLRGRHTCMHACMHAYMHERRRACESTAAEQGPHPKAGPEGHVPDGLCVAGEVTGRSRKVMYICARAVAVLAAVCELKDDGTDMCRQQAKSGCD